MECGCCGTVKPLTFWMKNGESESHLNPTSNFEGCKGTYHQKCTMKNVLSDDVIVTLSLLFLCECVIETFVTNWGRRPGAPGCAPGTNGLIKGITELHYGNCMIQCFWRFVNTIQKYDTESLSGPFEMLHCNKTTQPHRPVPTTCSIFAPFFIF